MAREKRQELAVGLQISGKNTAVTYSTRSMKEPVTLGIRKGGPLQLFELPEAAAKMLEGDQNAAAAAEEFFRTLLQAVPGFTSFEDIRIMITMPRLEDGVEKVLPDVLTRLGMDRKNIYLQDYLSSFYYYTVNQKKELWNGDVALLEYNEPYMIGYVLQIDAGKTPALASAVEAGRVEVSEKGQNGADETETGREKDQLLFELLKKIFDRRNVVTSFLLGDYFDSSWAVRSFQYLCFHRHAFQGENLYTQGACYAAMSRSGMIREQDILFLSSSMIQENLGMYMRVRGREIFYPVISAGVNWYEAHHECEFIPDRENRITLVTRPMAGGTETEHVLRLSHFPDRPNRATRLKMTVYFTSASCCVVEVEDMGFGGFFRPDGKKWKRTIAFG